MEGLFVVFSSFPSYYEFGTTELNSTFETTAVVLSPLCRVKPIWVRHYSSATFGTGLNCLIIKIIIIKHSFSALSFLFFTLLQYEERLETFTFSFNEVGSSYHQVCQVVCGHLWSTSSLITQGTTTQIELIFPSLFLQQNYILEIWQTLTELRNDARY